MIGTDEPASGASRASTAPRLRTVSLRFRSTLTVLLVLLLVIAGLAVVVDRTFAVQATRNANALLVGRAQLARQLARQGVGPQQLINRVDARGVRAGLQLPDGRVFGTPPPTGQRDLVDQVTLAGSGRLAGAVLTLAVDRSAIDSAQRTLRRSLLLTGLGALALGAVLITVGLRLALRPLDAFGALAREVISGRRGGRLGPDRTDTELGQAAAAVDGMLDTLEGAEQHARDAEAEARRAATRSQEFLADAAHELRTPIAGVQVAAETLLHQGSGPDSALGEADREQLLVLLIREAQRAGRLTEDLLTTARLDVGLEVQRARFDLADLLRGEADRTALLHPGLDVAVHGLGRLADPLLDSDPARIRSVIGNLLGNAARAAAGPRRDGSAGTVVVTVTEEPGRVQVMITDDGPGIPPGDRERVFERLVRLDPSRTREPVAERSGGSPGTRSGESAAPTGGAGLGLAISRGYARALGGELVCVEPPPGVRGAAFVLTLPR